RQHRGVNGAAAEEHQDEGAHHLGEATSPQRWRGLSHEARPLRRPIGARREYSKFGKNKGKSPCCWLADRWEGGGVSLVTGAEKVANDPGRQDPHKPEARARFAVSLACASGLCGSCATSAISPRGLPLT